MGNEERVDLWETYDFLLSPRRIADEIWRKDIRRQELRACLFPAGIAYNKDRVQTNQQDQMAEIMAEVAELDKEIESLQGQRAILIRRIGRAIDQLGDSRERVVLDAYYIGQMSMTEIAEYMHYSLQHIYRLRDSGVKNMRKMLKGSMLL